jgi:hypothetical protein
MKQNEQLKQPFFAQFLESQKTKASGSTENHEEGWPGVTFPVKDYDQTHKYPSDGDDDYPAM